MTFDYPGYDLKFIQKRRCNDASDHLCTYIYKFYSPKTKLHYVINADYHKEDVCAIKFYAKIHRKSYKKYNKVVNRGDLGNILISCLKCIPIILSKHPKVSFGFIGAPTFDEKNRREEIANNQRFRIYSQIAAEKIGSKTFTHLKYEEISGYLLVNNKFPDKDKKVDKIKKMLSSTYNHIPY